MIRGTPLPALSDDLFVTDGGLETTLIFHEGLDLPCFAAFDVMRNERGRDLLRHYYRTYASLAREHGVGLILESPTWRASRDWGERLGRSPAELDSLNHACIDLLEEIRREFESDATPVVISACIGPRGDGYDPTHLMTEADAQAYHSVQIETLAATSADFVSAFTLPYMAEAVGITRAAEAAGMPVVLSFTVETDGRLPTGQTLRETIEAVDEATNGSPAYYMVNCAHPTHFIDALPAGETWITRIRGIRANASTMSHAELDEAEELDAGDVADLALRYRDLMERLPNLNVLGGCCGTDELHIEEILRVCLPVAGQES